MELYQDRGEANCQYIDLYGVARDDGIEEGMSGGRMECRVEFCEGSNESVSFMNERVLCRVLMIA